MLRLTGMIVCAIATTAPASPEPPTGKDPMALAYANTITIDIPAANFSVRRFVDPDHTYRDVSATGVTKGVWVLEGDKVCYTQTNPKPVPAATYCNPLQAHAVGDTWSNTDPDSGADVQISLVEGRR